MTPSTRSSPTSRSTENPAVLRAAIHNNSLSWSTTPTSARRRVTLPEFDRLRIPESITNDVIEHALGCAPLEACGLIAADSSGNIQKFYPIPNIEESSLRFTLEPAGHFEAITDAEERGWQILGVVHSHVSSPASPSEIDLAQPHDPD